MTHFYHNLPDGYEDYVTGFLEIPAKKPEWHKYLRRIPFMVFVLALVANSVTQIAIWNRDFKTHQFCTILGGIQEPLRFDQPSAQYVLVKTETGELQPHYMRPFDMISARPGDKVACYVEDEVAEPLENLQDVYSAIALMGIVLSLVLPIFAGLLL